MIPYCSSLPYCRLRPLYLYLEFTDGHLTNVRRHKRGDAQSGKGSPDQSARECNVFLRVGGVLAATLRRHLAEQLEVVVV